MAGNLEFISMFSQPAAIELMDGVACALLAAAAAARARALQACLSGAVMLGCVCGLVCPLLRETFLHGQMGASMIIRALPDDVFIGALFGVISPSLLPAIRRFAFFCLDSIGMCLAASLCAIIALDDLGIIGAISLGLCASLAPGMVRDVALGDIAMFVERSWYAASAALAAMMALGVVILATVQGGDGWLFSLRGEVAVVTGAVTGICIRFWKDENRLE